MSTNNGFSDKVSLIWSIADLLRGSWKQYEYQDVILPLVLLKRLDVVLELTKAEVIRQNNQFEGKVNVEPILKKTAGVGFYNKSPFDFYKLLEDPAHIGANFRKYIDGYSANIQDIIEKFDFEKQLQRLEGGNLLYEIVKRLNTVELDPKKVDNHEMGTVFEELLRKFSEQSNETAGEHYSPRDVVQLAVELVITPDIEELKRPHVAKRVYDCACGTGGMLSLVKETVEQHINRQADMYLYGQELNPQTYALCKADMLIKGEDPNNIKGGDKDHSVASTLSNDQFFGDYFDYLLTNPPFGVDWKKDKVRVEKEAERGYSGRFGAGTPRVSDGQLLFLQHMVSKMRPAADGGARLGIILNGSPLFTGSAGSGESEIRRWLLEKDLVETIVSLPDQLFYNTGINTYIWVLSNRKSAERKNKVQLIDAREIYHKLRKSLGNKRKELIESDREKILELHEEFKDSKHSKIFDREEFGYRQITVERPLQLNFSTDTDRIERLKLNKIFEIDLAGKKKPKYTAEQQVEIFKTLNSLPKKVFKKQDEFLLNLHTAFKSSGAKLDAVLEKIIISELSDHDDEADVITNKKGQPESDSNLRDAENVPLNKDIHQYFAEEVKPYVPSAWINEKSTDHKDGKIGKVGYEIPVSRYFYEYQPPRELKEIETDIKHTEGSLLTLIQELSV